LWTHRPSDGALNTKNFLRIFSEFSRWRIIFPFTPARRIAFNVLQFSPFLGFISSFETKSKEENNGIWNLSGSSFDLVSMIN
jgi:hypothetical protein